MKNIIHKHRFFLLLAICAVFIQSCNDKWDEHYKSDSIEGDNITLFEYINSRPNLSIFSNLLKETGYDSLLNTTVSYTVWAPDNDALAGIDLTDETYVYNLVRNHIKLSRMSTARVDSGFINMMSGKGVSFIENGGIYRFGTAELTLKDIPVANGLVNEIDGYAPYLSNIWEYINDKEGLDSLKSYLYGNTLSILDPVNSVPIGYDEDGNTIYDTVFVFQNEILDDIGQLYNEDSIYTTILPNNIAWNESYEHIHSFFNIPEGFGGEERGMELSKFALIQDMVFRGTIYKDQAYDSIVSTSGNVFYSPSYLFENIESENVSNGLVYVSSKMPFVETTSWFKEIRVEAEEVLNRKNVLSTINNRSSYGSSLDVSENEYILVQPTSTSSKPNVTFSIPNVLSGKYNIYCVFVPESILDDSKKVMSKVAYTLAYIYRSSDGRSKTQKITPDNNVIQAEGLTKMWVTEFDFEYANVIDEDYKDVKVTLKVENIVTSTDVLDNPEYTRDMRIDCIILEPVTE